MKIVLTILVLVQRPAHLGKLNSGEPIVAAVNSFRCGEKSQQEPLVPWEEEAP
jgi:hypothetical protein